MQTSRKRKSVAAETMRGHPWGLGSAGRLMAQSPAGGARAFDSTLGGLEARREERERSRGRDNAVGTTSRGDRQTGLAL